MLALLSLLPVNVTLLECPLLMDTRALAGIQRESARLHASWHLPVGDGHTGLVSKENHVCYSVGVLRHSQGSGVLAQHKSKITKRRAVLSFQEPYHPEESHADRCACNS